MKLYVEVNGKLFEIEADRAGETTYRVRLGGIEHTVDHFALGPNEASFLIGAAPATYWFGENGLAHDGARTYRVRVQDERARFEETVLRGRAGVAGAYEVRSIMPGIVTRVLVKEGDVVDVGAPLLMIEAMKMENEVRSESPGVVRAVHVRPGSTVEANEVLVDLGPREAS